MLKTKLKSGGRTPLARKHALEVLDRLQQGISPAADRWRLLAAEPRAPGCKLLTQFAPEAIDRLQRERQPEFFGGGFHRESGQRLHQPEPYPRGRERVPRQHVRQHEREGAPTTAALAAIGTEHPLAAQTLAAGLIGIVAAQDAVPVQRFGPPAAGTALLLEGKSVCFSAGSSRTK
jgi:hypothetical protein